MKRTYFSLVFILAFVVLAQVRCATKLGPIDTTVTVLPLMQETSESELVRAEGWKGFYFEADSLTYKVPSLEAAIKGEMVAVEGGGTLAAAGEAEFQDAVLRFHNLNRNPLVLVIVHPDSLVYAWRQMELVDGLDSMGFNLTFRFYNTTLNYIQNKWNIVMPLRPDEEEEPEPEPEPEE